MVSNSISSFPFAGFNVETIEYKGVNFVAWDVSGRDKIVGSFCHACKKKKKRKKRKKLPH